MRYWLLARALVEMGHAVVIWSGDFHHVTKRRRTVEKDYTYEGIRVRLVPVLPYGRNVCWRRWRSHAGYVKAWGRLAREAVDNGELERPDCLVLAMPPADLFDAAESLCQQWGCRIVADIQDAWPETYYRLLPRGVRWLGPLLLGTLRRAARRAYRGADAVSAVAEQYVRLVRSAGCKVETAVFPLATEIGGPIARGIGAEKHDGVRLCYVGNLGATYDIDTMLEGVRRLVAEGGAVSLSVAGDGPQRGRVERAAAECPEAVHYAGYLERDAMRALMTESDIGLVPMASSSWVAVPNKLVDYAAAGLAVVNGLGGEAQALLDQFQAGIAYQFGDVASFVTAVRRYVGDKELLVRHQKEARRLAEERFDAARVYREMADWLTRK